MIASTAAAPFSEADDLHYMQQAIRLAMSGRGFVEPNPMVGCVIVKDGQIIGQGFHERFGSPHAEPNALARCSESPSGAIAYVTLEPCCHLGKKTPPCVPRLIGARLSRVVVGCVDPNPQVAGKGIAELRAAGITVDQSAMTPEARQLNAAFFKYIEHRRPYVTLKWAQTADGKIAGPAGKRLFISNPTSHTVLHQLRARCDAILVGIRTVLADDPQLTARGVTTERPLLRVVLDPRLQLPLTSQLVETIAHGPVVICCDEEIYHRSHETRSALNARGIEIMPLRTDADGELSLPQLLDDLGGRGVTHLLVEPGMKLAASFLQDHLTDRVWVFHSPKRLDLSTDPVIAAAAATAPSAASVPFPAVGHLLLRGDRLTEHLNPKSSAFFALARSADFVLAESHVG